MTGEGGTSAPFPDPPSVLGGMDCSQLQNRPGLILFVSSGVVSTVAGGGKAHEGGKTDCVDYSSPMMDGIGTEARFHYPWGIVFDPTENVLYVADCVS